MIYPESLKKGDTVGLAAPAFAVPKERLEACVRALEELGFHVKVGETLQRVAPLFGEMERELKEREAAQKMGQGNVQPLSEAVARNAGTQQENALPAEAVKNGGIHQSQAQQPDGVTGDAVKPQQSRYGQEILPAPLKACSSSADAEDMSAYLETGYLGGNPKKRAADLNTLFADPEVKAVFCVRGGYGSAQVMPYLDYELIARHPKIFAGFSDITNLLNAFASKCGFVTWHAPMVSSNMACSPMDAYTRASFAHALMEDWEVLVHQNPEDHPLQCWHAGRAAGRLVGGNVTVLARTCGTFYQPDTQGRILFLEDVGESVASIDMYLAQMENAGLFDGIKGLLLGDFNDCTNSYNPSFGVDDMLRARFSARGIPVLAHIRSGHETPMATLPVGAWCELDAANGALRFLRR